MARRSAQNPLGVELFDSHCHLTDQQFSDELSALVKRAASCGVREMMTVAQSVPDSRETVALAGRFDGVYCAVGIHPHEADTFRSTDIQVLKDMCIDPKVKAVGEIGLDFFRAISSRHNQETAFRAQVGLARMVALPMVVHVRDAGPAARELLDEEAYYEGVLHCFSGEKKLLEWAVQKGMYVSFAGNVTYGEQRLVESARQVPRERLMLETDAPYLAPAPHRGKRNEPALLRHTLEAVAAMLELTPAELADLTRTNARRCFRIN